MTYIQKINPINKDEEKEKFLFDPLYNPQFKYEFNDVEQAINRYGHVSFEFFELAKKIIDKVIAQYRTESSYLDQIEGKILSKEDVLASIENYLSKLNLQNSMEVTFSKNFVARTSVHLNQIHVRLPIEHREKTLSSILNHEIGTHYLRNLNESRQPWFKKRLQYGLRSALETEEGLAVIHFFLNLEKKHLWQQALYYYAICRGEQLSFSNLFHDLEKYIDNKERRWRVCLRVKRGIKDTSEFGANSKDQVYLRGVIRVSSWLRSHSFDIRPLYVGKIAIEDLELVSNISQKFEPVLPKFFLDDKKFYADNVKSIISQNGLNLKDYA